MTHGEFIRALGGGTAVAQWLAREANANVGREAVYKWSGNSVPWKWRPYLTKLASEKGIAIPADFMPVVLQ